LLEFVFKDEGVGGVGSETLILLIGREKVNMKEIGLTLMSFEGREKHSHRRLHHEKYT
jgi:hypothetical protein